MVDHEGTAILSRPVEQTLAIKLMRWDWGRGNTMKSDSEAPEVYYGNTKLARN